MAYGPRAQILPLTTKQYEYWQKEVERAERVRDDRITEWGVSANIDRYECKTKHGEVNDGSDFSDSERKRAGLFYDTPFITVVPDPEAQMPPGMPSPAVLHQEVLNSLLDEPMMNAKATALKAIQVALVAIQPAWTKIGYIPTIVEVPKVDPILQLPILGPDNKTPVMVPQVVHEEFFFVNISARAGLLPVDLRDTDYDRVAPWLGYKWRMSASRVRKTWGVPENVRIPGASGERELSFTDDEAKPEDDQDDPMCTGVYIEYKAALVDPEVVHPGLIRCLVLVDGLRTPVKHEDASWLIDPVTKQFNPRSGFTGFSIHPLALRDRIDSGWVQADSTITSGLTGEVTDYLHDLKRQRQGNTQHNVYDPTAFPPEIVDRIRAGHAPRDLPVKPGALAQGIDNIFKQVTPLESGREHYLGLDVFQGKRERVLGVAANTVGARDDTRPTATEIASEDRNTEARFEQERQRAVGAWYLSAVRKISALVVRYGDKLALEILGQKRGQIWIQARNAGLLSRFTYRVQIDGGKYMDARAERKFWVDLYNVTAKDPNVRRTTTLKKIASFSGLDPAEWVIDQLPEPKPDPAKVTVSVAASDINPVLPNFAIVIKILRQGGYDITDEDVMLAQQQAQMLPMMGRNTTTGEAPNDPIEAMASSTPAPASGVGANPRQQGPPQHGGAAEPADRINQHQLDQTGNRPGPTVN